MSQQCKGTLGDCPSSQICLSFIEFLEFVCNALFVYSKNVILLGVFDGAEDQTVRVAVFLSYDREQIRYKTIDSVR